MTSHPPTTRNGEVANNTPLLNVHFRHCRLEYSFNPWGLVILHKYVEWFAIQSLTTLQRFDFHIIYK